jgi:Flp pilus assembly pilin Flp
MAFGGARKGVLSHLIQANTRSLIDEERQIEAAQHTPDWSGQGRTRIMELVDRIVREEEGQDLIEYALIAGFISVICYVAIKATGTSVSKIWDKVKTAVDAAAA